MRHNHEYLPSMSHVRSKIYQHTLDQTQMSAIIKDIADGHYSEAQIACFLTACSSGQLSLNEMTTLTNAMVGAGQTLNWQGKTVVDKHCVGGLPGNRTTPIVVAIVAAYGLLIPKTSSRAITSASGTADTMEVLTKVDLNLEEMKAVVEQENGCFIWGGSIALSPADDVMIRVEHDLDLDSEGQLVASVLSKKLAAGSTHVLIDIPIGETAKVRSEEMADMMRDAFLGVSEQIGIQTTCIYSDGTQPIGRRIGPALEALGVLDVLRNNANASDDLRDKALTLAGHLIECADGVAAGTGYQLAKEILDSGKALDKFMAICEAQGRFSEPGEATIKQDILATKSGHVTCINNRSIARIAKQAGAPEHQTAGIELHAKVGSSIKAGEPLLTLHAESHADLLAAVKFYELEEGVFGIK